MQKTYIIILSAFFMLMLISSCNQNKNKKRKQMQVTATAYNSVAYQTSGNPRITAWGDTLEPGMKAIAVSRDLIDSGLVHLTEVKIEGLPGKYIVRDKMASRWVRKIDIYMGDSIQKAREWGRQKVTISWKDNTANATAAN